MRVVSWFSCGAASAVATKLAMQEHDVTIAYCEVKEEHEDNKRFLKDCERWFGKEILILGNDEYDRSIDTVFQKTRYMAGVSGARCTLELKKRVREKFERPDDIHVFGYTVEEQHRVDRLLDANNLNVITPLIDHNLKKEDCLAMLDRAGIELPAMYRLGYKNNNCRGCVKAQSPSYWLKIKKDFPERFKQISRFEKLLNVRIVKITEDGESKRVQLDEIPDRYEAIDDNLDIQCGIFCLMAEGSYQ